MPKWLFPKSSPYKGLANFVRGAKLTANLVVIRKYLEDTIESLIHIQKYARRWEQEKDQIRKNNLEDAINKDAIIFLQRRDIIAKHFDKADLSKLVQRMMKLVDYREAKIKAAKEAEKKK